MQCLERARMCAYGPAHHGRPPTGGCWDVIGRDEILRVEERITGVPRPNQRAPPATGVGRLESISASLQELKDSSCGPDLAICTADPDDRPFFIHKDWSLRGCGAILTQYDDDYREYIIAAISRTLLPA
eukprot:1181502-Prorocentrum_minimum.AAC.1